MDHEKLRPLGWKPFFQQQLQPDEGQRLMVARVSAHHGGQVLLLSEDGEFPIPVQLAEADGEVAVGDWLLLEPPHHRTIRRLERQTLLERKAAGEEVRPQLIAANIDTMFIVSSCNLDFNLSRLERYLALTLQSGATPVVVLTKADLCTNPVDFRKQAEQLHPGLLVETLDARNPTDVEVLSEWCRTGQSVALIGSSGVGKSTLAVALGAGHILTGGIREHDAKGRHTTTARSLHQLPNGGMLVDNPGMRELQLPECEDGITELFDDVLSIAVRCRFADCGHQGDVGCAITAAIEEGALDQRRFDSFMKLQAEQAWNARSLAERRERDRKTGQMYKSVMAEKKNRRDTD